ncbi:MULTISPECIES: helix-turn-helix domain-containing protein [Streptomyces]|uniref:helix-turn-helix domain-containing protein n=1 Tax=Streptomyces TaxID=1883 RepID=UPI002E297FD8|nr:helix-turn-helix domain-containing protein [Streptomyces ureilyticus]WSZ63661.1 helix-turn-helix domain-containing protein [Streptomyces canus]
MTAPAALVERRGPAALRTGGERRQQRGGQFPQTVRNQPLRKINTHEEASCRSSLRCAEGGTNQRAAADLGIDRSTVDRRRARFIAKRLDGLHDEPSSGRPPSILLDQVEEVVVDTWSRSRARTRTGHGPRWPGAPVCRDRRSGGSGSGSTLSPTCKDSFKLSTDPQKSSTGYPQVRVPPRLLLGTVG